MLSRGWKLYRWFLVLFCFVPEIREIHLFDGVSEGVGSDFYFGAINFLVETSVREIEIYPEFLFFEGVR